MYPNLYYLILDLFGIEFCLAKAVQTFGFFVAIAFLACAYVFTLEMKRKEALGLLLARKVVINKEEEKASFSKTQYAINLLLWGLVGYKLGGLLLDSCLYAEDIRSYLFSSEGSVLIGILGAVYGYYVTYKEERIHKEHSHAKKHTIHPYEYVGNMTFIAAIFGMLGAKLFHLLENPSEIPAMFESINSFFSGLTMYGGLIVASIAVLYYAKKNGLTIIHVADACMPGLLLAYGIGRLGCQMSGDGDWGIDNLAAMPQWLSFLPDWFWAYTYPNNVINAGIPIKGCVGNFCHALPNPVFPTPLYESVFSIVAFVVLWIFRNRITTAGVMTCIYLMINGFERFWIEKIRINEVASWTGFNITQAEIISSIFFLGGLIGLIYLLRKKS